MEKTSLSFLRSNQRSRPGFRQFRRLGELIRQVPISTMLVASMVGLAVVSSASVALLVARNLDAGLAEINLERMASHAAARVEDLETYAGDARADVLVLTASTSVLQIAGEPSHVSASPALDSLSASRAQLGHHLLQILAIKPQYYEYRLIGVANGGREIVRVERGPDGARIVPESQLQPEGDTDYFIRALKLKPGEVYVSPMELSREHGAAEHPPVPVVRMATPLYGGDGHAFGILIINVDLRPLFSRFKALPPYQGEIRIVNQDGEYVLHPDSSKAFRFEQAAHSRAQDEFPSAENLINRSQGGTAIIKDREGKTLGIAVRHGSIAGQVPFAVIDTVPYGALLAPTGQLRNEVLVVGAMVAAIAALLALLIARTVAWRIEHALVSTGRIEEGVDGLFDAGPGWNRARFARAFAKLAVGGSGAAREVKDELGRRRQQDQLLRQYVERDRLYGAVVESASDAIITKTLDGVITGWNHAAESLFGYTANEAIGKPIDLIVPPERRNEVRTILARVGNGERIEHFRTVRVAKNGRNIEVSLSISPVRSASNQIIGAAKIARDITEVRLSEQKFELAVEASPSGVLMVDKAGHIVLANTEVERQFGYDRKELAGRPIDVLVPERLRGSHAGHRSSFYAAPSVRAMGAGRELFGLRKDGSEFPIEIGLNPIGGQDGLMVLATIIDITARRDAEGAIEAQNEQLRRSNAELEQFAYVASHDLQEPLRMVASYTQLLQERYKGKLDEKADKYIHYAVDGATRMQNLVRDLLAYSRLSAKEKLLKPVDAGAVVQATLDRLSMIVSESGAEVTLGSLPTVMSDEIELGQVFQNLIGNAIKFRSTAPPAVEISARRVGKMWEFMIADNGIGIDAKYSERIFQMFQRLHERGKYDGSGIGLAIAKKIVERNGGTIRFESVVGRWTKFYFTIRGMDET